MLPYVDRTKDKVHVFLRVFPSSLKYRHHKPLFIKGDETPYGITGWTFEESEAKQYPANEETERFIRSLSLEVRTLHAQYPRPALFDAQLVEASLRGGFYLPGFGDLRTREEDEGLTNLSIRTVEPSYGQCRMYTIEPLQRHFPHNEVWETTFAQSQPTHPHDLSPSK